MSPAPDLTIVPFTVIVVADTLNVVTVSVPPELIVIEVTAAVAALTVTLCVLAIITASPAIGTLLGDHVAAVFQFPVPALVWVSALATDTITTAAKRTTEILNSVFIFLSPFARLRLVSESTIAKRTWMCQTSALFSVG